MREAAVVACLTTSRHSPSAARHRTSCSMCFTCSTIVVATAATVWSSGASAIALAGGRRSQQRRGAGQCDARLPVSPHAARQQQGAGRLPHSGARCRRHRHRRSYSRHTAWQRRRHNDNSSTQRGSCHLVGTSCLTFSCPAACCLCQASPYLFGRLPTARHARLVCKRSVLLQSVTQAPLQQNRQQRCSAAAAAHASLSVAATGASTSAGDTARL
jgi:hypothetical protein